MRREVQIKAADLGGVIARELKMYSDEITEKISAEAEKSCYELVRQTYNTAPVGNRKKHYKQNITFKKIQYNLGHTKYIWYVKGPDYRLSHLLENGHALRNGGRVAGTHFIKKAADPIIEAYLKAVEEVIKNG